MCERCTSKLTKRIEESIRANLRRAGLYYRRFSSTEFEFLPGAAPSFYFPAERVAVFVDDCWVHGCPEHSKRLELSLVRLANEIKCVDHQENVELVRRGWACVRVWQHADPERATLKIGELVIRRRIGREMAA